MILPKTLKSFAMLVVSVALLAAGVAAQAQPVDAPLPESEALKPEVTIIQRQDETVYEYRISGRVYMVKVIPSAGPSYYLLDNDGDGELDAQRYGPTEVSVPQWVIFRW